MRSVTKALPRQPRRDGHFAALPYAQVPDFVASLREQTTWGRLALEALILTAARSGEIRGARWSELDLDHSTWTIPAERMKGGKLHSVPLSDSAVAVFRKAAELKMSKEFVFPGRDPRKSMSDMTMTKLLRDMNIDATVHGFRSSFRDWVAEETNFPSEVAEAALAHAIPNRVEAAYRRTDFLAKRRQMMAAWAAYVEGTKGKVVRLKTRPKSF
jgi:integrase